jgi:tetratricopeptide (TPR) repeat protein
MKAAAGLLILIAGCSHSGPRGTVERIALLHLDNLTSDAARNWFTAAVPAVVAVSLASSPQQFAFVAASTNEAHAGRATRIVRGYLTGAGERLVAHLTEFDARSGQTLERWEVLGSTPADLGGGIARRLWPQAPPLEPKLSADPQAALRALTERLAVNVPPGKAAEVAKLRPSDSRLAALAGRQALIARDLKKAGEWFDRAIALDPENGPLHNEAAYVLFYAGKMEAALASLDQYNRLEPSSANPLDSRGEILLLAGRYADAEEAFLQSYQRDPRFFSSAALRKAAVARRAAGDQQGADSLFQRYLDAIAGNPGTDLYRAQWDYEAGRPAQAIAALEKLNTPPARLQLSLWRGETDGLRDTAQATALKLSLQNDHAAAIPALKALIAAERPMEATQWEVLLAWAYAESGRPDEAKRLIARHPIPGSTPSFWESVVMVRYRELKKKLG